VKNKAGTRPHGLTAGSPATMNRAHSDRSMRPNSTKRKANQSERLRAYAQQTSVRTPIHQARTITGKLAPASWSWMRKVRWLLVCRW